MPIKITKRPYAKTFSGNPVHYELTSQLAALDPAIYFEIKIVFRYYTGSFTEICTLPFYPVNGVAEINIQDLLHSQLKPGMPALDVADARAPMACPEQTGEFYIAFREITSLDLDPAWDISEMNFTCMVIRGGINYFQWRGNNFWVNYFNIKKPFLTWQQVGRMAALDEWIYLSFLNTSTTDGPMVARCRAKFTDGTEVVQELTFTAAANQVHQVPAGGIQWNLAALDPAKQIHFWDVMILENISDGVYNNITEVFRFMADNRPSLSGITLHYRNSLNGLDSVRVVTGLIDESLDYTYTEQNRNAAADYFSGDVITPKKTIGETLEVHTYKGDIGHLGKEEQDRLRDAQLQREVYMLKGSKWWPVNIITKNFKLRSTGDFRFTMPIEFTLAYEGAEYYTPASVDLGQPINASNVCLAFLEDLAITVDLESADAEPGFAMVTIEGTELDEQDASAEFRFQIPGVQGWQNIYYAQLPYSFQMPIDQDYLLQYQSICTGDVLGGMRETTFNTQTIPPAPVFPFVISEVSNSGTPGGTRSQLFKFQPGSDNYNAVLPAGLHFWVQVYSHMVSVSTSEPGSSYTTGTLLDELAARINATTAAQWNSAGSAPAAGTPGFKPTAQHGFNSLGLLVTLNYQNQFSAGGEFE